MSSDATMMQLASNVASETSHKPINHGIDNRRSRCAHSRLVVHTGELRRRALPMPRAVVV